MNNFPKWPLTMNFFESSMVFTYKKKFSDKSEKTRKFYYHVLNNSQEKLMKIQKRNIRYV